ALATHPRRTIDPPNGSTTPGASGLVPRSTAAPHRAGSPQPEGRLPRPRTGCRASGKRAPETGLLTALDDTPSEVVAGADRFRVYRQAADSNTPAAIGTLSPI